ncbi:Nuclear pore complex protein Nup98-Nup96 [Chytridiales sp. JEL 0842]|nr:Nuclear pore complex protein Nup98-Nup96 [Chytridiales sp. JEL 0842]
MDPVAQLLPGIPPNPIDASQGDMDKLVVWQIEFDKINSYQKKSYQYVMEPEYHILMQLPDKDLRSLPNFTITRSRYGQIRFLQPVNLLEASPTGCRCGIRDIPSQVVIINRKEVEVNPEGNTPACAVGTGLNVEAEVSLYGCWPKEYMQRNISVCNKAKILANYAQRLKLVEGTSLLDYSATTGSWIFKVDHFSRYGLDDDDDDDEEGELQHAPAASSKRKVQNKSKSPLFQQDNGYDVSEEDEEEDGMVEDESFSIREDSFAKIKGRKLNVKPVSDLRKVATRNILKSHVETQQSYDEEGTDSLDDNEYYGEDDEEEEEYMGETEGNILDELDNHDDEGSEEEKEPIEVTLTLDADETDFVVPPRNKRTISNVAIMEQESGDFVPQFREASDMNHARKIKVMRASLFDVGSTLPSVGPTVHRVIPTITSSVQPVLKSIGASMAMDTEQETKSVEIDDSLENYYTTNNKRWAADAEQEPIVAYPDEVEPFDSHTRSSFAFTNVNEKRIPDFQDSIIANRQTQCADASLLMGRGCRIGWGPNNSFVVCGKSPSGNGSFSTVQIQSLITFLYQKENDASLRSALLAAEKERHIVSLKTVYENSDTYLASLPPLSADSMEENEEPDLPESEKVFEAQNDMFDEHSMDSGVSLPRFCPVAKLRDNFQFLQLASSAYQASVVPSTSNELWKPTSSSSPDDPRRVFTRMELSLWKCASALWDPLNYLSTDPETQKLLVGSRGEAITAALRKESVSRWLKEAVASAIEQDLSSGSQISSGTRLFHMLTGRWIGKAVKEALADRNFRLATIISQAGGAGARVLLNQTDESSMSPAKLSSSVLMASKKSVRAASGHGIPGRGNMAETTREDIKSQIHIWRKLAGDSNVPPEYMRIWNLLSGDVKSWGEELVKVPGDWRRRWGLFLWYAEGGGLSLQESLSLFDEYWNAIQKPPVPSYLERKLSVETIDDFEKIPRDICYEMLKLAVEPTYLLERAIKPSTITAQPLDYRVTWLIWVVLARAKKLREFSDASGAVTLHRLGSSDSEMRDLSQSRMDTLINSDAIATLMHSSTADRSTISFINALETLGLWKWACFAALFLSDRLGRERKLRDILSIWFPATDNSRSCGRNVRAGNMAADMSELPMETSADWQFVVEKLKVPGIWIHEAKALRAKYDHDPLQEAISLIDARSYTRAYNVVMSVFCPKAIINSDFITIKSLLSYIPSDHIDSWTLGGGLVLDYVEIIEKLPNLIAVAKTSHIYQDLNTTQGQIQAESIRASVAVVVKEITELWMPRLHSILMALVKLRSKGLEKTCFAGVKYFAYPGGDQWQSKICISEMASRILSMVHECEAVCDVTFEIDSETLKALPVPEDQRLSKVSAMANEWLKANTL